MTPPCGRCATLLAEHYSGAGRPLLLTPEAALAIASAAQLVSRNPSCSPEARLLACQLLHGCPPRPGMAFLLTVGPETLCAACTGHVGVGWGRGRRGAALTPLGFLAVVGLIESLGQAPPSRRHICLEELCEAVLEAMSAVLPSGDDSEGGR
jgi:hypothetical protein